MSRRPTILQVQRAVADHYGFTVLDLKSNRQGPALCHARHIAVHMCRRLTLVSNGTIAHAFGDRDLATIRHSLRMVDEKLVSSARLKAAVATLAARIASAADAPELTAECVLTALLACRDSVAEAEACLEEAQGIVREQGHLLETIIVRVTACRGSDIGELAA